MRPPFLPDLETYTSGPEGGRKLCNFPSSLLQRIPQIILHSHSQHHSQKITMEWTGPVTEAELVELAMENEGLHGEVERLQGEVDRLQELVHRTMRVQLNLDKHYSTLLGRLETEKQELKEELRSERERVNHLTLAVGVRSTSLPAQRPVPQHEQRPAPEADDTTRTPPPVAPTVDDTTRTPPPVSSAEDVGLPPAMEASKHTTEARSFEYDVYEEDGHGGFRKVNGPLSMDISNAIGNMAVEWNSVSLANFSSDFLQRPVLPSLQCIDRRVHKSISLDYLNGEDRVKQYACYSCVRGGIPCVRLYLDDLRPCLCPLPPAVRPPTARTDELAYYVKSG